MFEKTNYGFAHFAPAALLALLAACSAPQSAEDGETQSDEDIPGEGERTASVSGALATQCQSGTDDIVTYARKCKAAMANVDMPGFNCDVGSTEPLRQGAVGAATCDAPNVLNGKCDNGSKFHMLRRNVNGDGIYIAAHCRKQSHAPGEFGDIAMIAYNEKNGATCFFQALASDTATNTLSGIVLSPSLGTSLEPAGGPYPWRTPAATSRTGGGCIACHDNGPFIRSPYLAQLGDLWPVPGGVADPNYLPGTIAAEEYKWNSSTMPYRFVGLDYQNWETYSVVNNINLPSSCTQCHRMGVAQRLIPGATPQRFLQQGTSLDFGLQATAPEGDPHYQLSKNPSYSVTSPIWMTPGSITSSPANITAANNTAICGNTFASSAFAVPPIDSRCQLTLFGRGDTCDGPPGIVINGKTKSDITTYTGTFDIPLGCRDQPGCPPAFYYWKSLHGPLYQTSAPSIAITSLSFRGSYAKIGGSNGGWVYQGRLDATDFMNAGKASPGAPGGELGGILFSQIASVPSIVGSGFTGFTPVTDPTGGQPTTISTLFSPSSAKLGVLSGFIGNVSTARTSFLKLTTLNAPSSTILTQSHIVAGAPATQWFTAEAFTEVAPMWTPGTHFATQEAHSQDDVQLVTAAVAPHVICYLTGIEGDWATSRLDGNGVMVQPYATIEPGASGDVRLRVWPPIATDPKGVGAWATCLTIN